MNLTTTHSDGIFVFPSVSPSKVTEDRQMSPSVYFNVISNSQT